VRAVSGNGRQQVKCPTTKAEASGLGLAYVPEALVEDHIAKGRLKRVLED